MPMRQSLWGIRWLILAPIVMIASISIAGCSLLGGTTSILPGNATVTAIVTDLPSRNCVPTLAAAPLPVTFGTSVTVIGSCWQPGESLSFAFVNPISFNLDMISLTTTVGANGRFSVALTLTNAQRVDVRDAHLPLIAYGPSFTQMAAVSLEVSG